MKVSDFGFDLPKDLIATQPASPRDSARLLHVTEGGLNDLHIYDLPTLLREGDVLVCNDTKVIPAKLSGRRGEAAIEVNLHKPIDGAHWDVFAKPARKLQLHDRLVIADDFYADVTEVKEAGERRLRFNVTGDAFFAALHTYGEIPLPPYIARKEGEGGRDNTDYQTIYAKHAGAVAAPTAGLHFTDRLLQQLTNKRCGQAFVTLHVGAGTFLPVKAEYTADHQMHSESFILSEETARYLNETRKNGGRIIAVGTTSVRVLESTLDAQGHFQPYVGETDIFITPGYHFRAIDALMTNFHLPYSTLFMLVSAFSGAERMKHAYHHAIAERYRFYSYGDACMLFPAKAAL